MSAQKNTVVVGASSGIGAAVARAFARRGDPVVLVARRRDLLEEVAASIRAESPRARVHVVVHDVVEIAGAPAAWEACAASLGGRPERVIFAAGIMPKVRLDEFDTQKDASMMSVNVVGAMAWLNLAAAEFLDRKSGQIVGISSVAGERGRVGAPAYNASKAALTSYLESLRNRLDRHGISVVTVKPGFIGTDMLKGVEKTFGVMHVDACAAVIVAACDGRRQSFFVPWWWGLVALVIRCIPSFLFRRLRV